MATDVTITDSRNEWDALVRKVKEVKRKNVPSVKVGLFAKQGSDLVKQAAANEFGATINHPGGTPYGYQTKNKAEQGRVRFMKKGSGFMVLGETDPHKIVIPERSFLRSTVIENKRKINEFVAKMFGDFIEAKVTLDKSLNRIGLLVVAMVRTKIRQGSFKPNKPSTIRKKKSSRPLIDTGRMRQSITHELDR
ncbi:hypothetical protein KAR91_26485 [Candidatus Pacearchaeota archaeon]|nr:hypothetical protein [Candidatus Pacearchaeota archaeon]